MESGLIRCGVFYKIYSRTDFSCVATWVSVLLGVRMCVRMYVFCSPSHLLVNALTPMGPGLLGSNLKLASESFSTADFSSSGVNSKLRFWSNLAHWAASFSRSNRSRSTASLRIFLAISALSFARSVMPTLRKKERNSLLSMVPSPSGSKY